MRKLNLIAVATAILLLSGCAAQLAPLMEMPAIPNDQVALVEAKIQFEKKNTLYEDVIQNLNRAIEVNSSIVINVPSSLFEEQSEESAKEQNFKTKDFFNLAEQQIEKELIRKGFLVLSRSKFEAKLRSLRDETRCNPDEYRCLYSQVSPEIQPILDDLTNKYDRREITALQYSDEIKRFKDKLQSSSAGRRRDEGEKELTDISEVIRAAESGDVQADYILQINMFDTEQKVTIETDLRHTPQIREFLRVHPAIRSQFENGHNIMPCRAAGSALNAKLIYVKTGEISWIGEHQLNGYSSGVQGFSVEMGSRKYVSNAEQIRDFVRFQNTEWRREERYGQIVNAPAPIFKEALIKPTISAGSCNQDWNASRETRSNLARQVAKELIQTIRVQ